MNADILNLDTPSKWKAARYYLSREDRDRIWATLLEVQSRIKRVEFENSIPVEFR